MAVGIEKKRGIEKWFGRRSNHSQGGPFWAPRQNALIRREAFLGGRRDETRGNVDGGKLEEGGI